MGVQLLPFPAAHYECWRNEQINRRRDWQFLALCADAEAATLRARELVDELAPVEGLSGTHLYRVWAKDDTEGWLWISRQADELIVLDADGAAISTSILPALDALARSGDCRYLVLERLLPAPGPARLALDPGFKVSSRTVVSETLVRLVAPAVPVAGPR